MDVHDVKLTISAVAAAQYPEDGRPEIAFLGRSNVGKSSLINKLIKRKAMARTSSVPGKTQTLNFYDLDSRLYVSIFKVLSAQDFSGRHENRQNA